MNTDNDNAPETISRFVAAYIEMAFNCCGDPFDEDGGSLDDNSYDDRELAPEALAQIKAECEAFQGANELDLRRAYATMKNKNLYHGFDPAEWAGCELWFTRNGHRYKGFQWEMLGDVGERLAEAARAMGRVKFYVDAQRVVTLQPREGFRVARLLKDVGVDHACWSEE